MVTNTSTYRGVGWTQIHQSGVDSWKLIKAYLLLMLKVSAFITLNCRNSEQAKTHHKYSLRDATYATRRIASQYGPARTCLSSLSAVSHFSIATRVK